ncbi:hypothetical protein ACFL1R_08245 [Candidatus Latescibacterota bacterium]
MTSSVQNEKNLDFLLHLQSDFPVISRPFQALAEKTGLTERKVINCLQSSIENHTVRTFGPVFDPKKLGYSSTLVAAEVEKERIVELAAVLLEKREITHNYLRDNEVNLWFTITALSEDIIKDNFFQVRNFPGVKQVFNLPVLNVYKISAVFGVEHKAGSYGTDPVKPLSDMEKKIVKALQMEFPLDEKPFSIIAETANTTESALINTVNKWLSEGIIRRFGVRLNHRKVGYTVNTLAAWQGEHIDTWGKKFAEISAVSHCYRRKSHNDWPYELYTMVHAKTEKEMNNIINSMRDTAQGASMIALKTLNELKKTSMKYFLEE